MRFGAYNMGLDSMSTIVGDDGAPPYWDNRTSFLFGDTVRHNARYWRATREVNPPLFPSFMSGDVPGDSDAWKPVGNSAMREQLKGLGVSRTILGAIDIQDWQRQMNTLKQVPVNVANVLLRYGQQVINPMVAVDQVTAKQAFMTPMQGSTSRATVKGKLDWHQARLAESNTAMAQLRADPKKFNTTPEQIDSTMYSPGEDLKKWVMQAFIEGNAVETGADTLTGAWSQMWREIATELAKLPKEVVKAVASAAGSLASAAIESATGVPLWAWAIGGAVLLGGVGFVAYKFSGRRS